MHENVQTFVTWKEDLFWTDQLKFKRMSAKGRLYKLKGRNNKDNDLFGFILGNRERLQDVSSING